MGSIVLQEECEGALIWLSEALYIFLWNIFTACQTTLAVNSMKARCGIICVCCIFLHKEGNVVCDSHASLKVMMESVKVLG